MFYQLLCSGKVAGIVKAQNYVTLTLIDLLNFSYIIFLRITPFLPNWFINLVSPVIGVRLAPFWIGTFIGVAPPSFVAIQAGTTLQQLTSSTDAITIWSVLMLAGFAILRYWYQTSKCSN